MNKNLKKDYETACNNYLKAFCEKHEFDYEPEDWVGMDVGNIARIGDYYVDMTTIRLDIDYDAGQDEFIQWYDYTLRLGSLGDTQYPNFYSWLSGCPRRSEEEILEMERKRQHIDKLQAELEQMIKSK